VKFELLERQVLKPINQPPFLVLGQELRLILKVFRQNPGVRIG
jgi:hypothetical protein